MAPKPYVFESREEIVSSMRHSAVQKNIDDFISQYNCSIEELVASSVSGNTFRAFPIPRDLGVRPSDCYRQWTRQWIGKIIDLLQAEPPTLTNGMLRSELISGARSLDDHWHKITSGRASMGFGRAAKLLGLSVKHLLWHSDLSPYHRQVLAAALDVPLDSYTLQGLRKAIPELHIPVNASMGYVKNEEQYNSIQDAIRGMCTEDLTPLHYETLAWGVSHTGIM